MGVCLAVASRIRAMPHRNGARRVAGGGRSQAPHMHCGPNHPDVQRCTPITLPVPHWAETPCHRGTLMFGWEHEASQSCACFGGNAAASMPCLEHCERSVSREHTANARQARTPRTSTAAPHHLQRYIIHALTLSVTWPSLAIPWSLHQEHCPASNAVDGHTSEGHSLGLHRAGAAPQYNTAELPLVSGAVEAACSCRRHSLKHALVLPHRLHFPSFTPLL